MSTLHNAINNSINLLGWPHTVAAGKHKNAESTQGGVVLLKRRSQRINDYGKTVLAMDMMPLLLSM